MQRGPDLLARLSRLSYALRIATEQLARRVEAGWRDALLLTRDLAVSGKTIAASLLLIGLYALPGLIALVLGVVLHSAWLGLAGAAWIIGLGVAARSSPPAQLEQDDAVLWTRYLPPAWFESGSLARPLMPVLREVATAEDHLERAERTESNEQLLKLFRELRRQLRTRMHLLRQEIARARRQRVERVSSPLLQSVERNAKSISADLLKYAALRARPAGEQAIDDDDLTDVTNRLRDTIDELRKLD